MKNLVDTGLRWRRNADSRYKPYGPWSAIGEDSVVIGGVRDHPRLDGRWQCFVVRPKDPNQQMYAYAGSLGRAKYFVERWAQYHQHKIPR